MDGDHMDDLSFESHFDIDKLSFGNVSSEFEKTFRGLYYQSLSKMSDANDRIESASGANTLGILEKMAQRMSSYDRHSDFEQSYHDLQEEYEPFTET